MRNAIPKLPRSGNYLEDNYDDFLLEEEKKNDNNLDREETQDES